MTGFGLTAVSGVLVDQQRWLRQIGGLLRVYLGVRTLLARPRLEPAAAGAGLGLAGAYPLRLALTLTNPSTILSFAAACAGLGLASGVGNYARATLLVLGVLLGSAAWWLLMSNVVSWLRSRFDSKAM